MKTLNSLLQSRLPSSLNLTSNQPCIITTKALREPLCPKAISQLFSWSKTVKTPTLPQFYRRNLATLIIVTRVVYLKITSKFNDKSIRADWLQKFDD